MLGQTRPVWVEPVTLMGREVRLEPLNESHIQGLYQATSPDLFQYMVAWWYGETLEHFAECCARKLADSSTLTFAVIHQESEQPIGSSSFMNIVEQHRGLEIGATWISKPHQGTRVNPEMKYLMIRHAVETLGAVRIQLKTDARNLHSQRAMEKLGAKREGVLRNHVILPDGFIRNSAFYSILPNEWPDVRAGLIKRLGYEL